MTAVPPAAARVSAVQFNAGKQAQRGPTPPLSLDNDGSPVGRQRECVEV